MSHVSEHCKKPFWFRGRFKNRPWICSCGKAWVGRYYGGIDTVIFTWVEWKPWSNDA